MTAPAPSYQEFRKLHPAVRCWNPYSAENRANRAASFRLGFRQRQELGHYFYIHPMVPNRAFDTAKQATTAAYTAHLDGDAK
jgi:hypothetical protein